MNHRKIYESLINRARNRNIDGYIELHHIIPRCLGGNDHPENLVKLTPEEHYVAHQLLVRIYPNDHSLAKAAAMMVANRPSNKMYGWIRKRFAVAQSISQSGENNSQFGSRWCHNPKTGETKKIKGSLEQDWVYGRGRKEKKSPGKRETSNKKQVDIYRDYYIIYEKVGFEKFVEITNYKYTKANLVQRFAKLLPEFKPQNGKKR